MRGIDTSAAVLPLRRSDTNLPDAGRLITALRQIGYSLEQALADLVDNAINARAATVLVRILHDGNAVKAIAVVDDGHGMGDAELQDAMRFGSRETNEIGTLGKFGMGLKLASFSHARSLSVYSNNGLGPAGRRWTVEGIRNGWRCERINAETLDQMLSRKWGPIHLSNGGSIVLWEDVDKLPSHRRGLRYTLTSLETKLRLHLGLCFHRFLEAGSLRILIDQLLINRVGQGLQSDITSLNPFAYAESGHPDYPEAFRVNLTGIGPLELRAHIWPPNSEANEYRLGRRSAARQGFYFYRNGRLIQAGGWNGLLQDETEPHSSLARVCIDLPIAYDEDFGVNVQKSTVLVPPVFPEVFGACSSRGATLEEYRRCAIDVYRSANSARATTGKFPGSGLPKAILKQLKSMYGRPSDPEGFTIRWAKLRDDEYFRLDREEKRILLNRGYRNTDTDKVVKLLMALLLRVDVASSSRTGRQRELKRINEMLIMMADE